VLYTRRREKEHLIVDVYRAWEEDIDGFKRKMVARFRMSNLSLLTYYLGIEVKQEGGLHHPVPTGVYREANGA